MGFHVHSIDDKEAGIRRCISCGRSIVIGTEWMGCEKEHLGTAAAGWAKWGLNIILDKD